MLELCVVAVVVLGGSVLVAVLWAKVVEEELRRHREAVD